MVQTVIQVRCIEWKDDCVMREGPCARKGPFHGHCRDQWFLSAGGGRQMDAPSASVNLWPLSLWGSSENIPPLTVWGACLPCLYRMSGQKTVCPKDKKKLTPEEIKRQEGLMIPVGQLNQNLPSEERLMKKEIFAKILWGWFVWSYDPTTALWQGGS